MTSDLDARAVAVIRGLAMDAPHAARSGHQGTAMALAPLAHVLWSRVLRYDAGDPRWADRDRFVLSAGHASILQYTMLFLTGHGLELDDLRAFRQWESATPGHPEAGHTAGVEVTTGPLGQGFANGVGMAIAEANLRARFGSDVCDHRVFGICGDGDLSEGLSHEAASFAGHLGLGRLVYVYDDNRITIDGPTDLALSDDAARRFAAYGWHVEELGEVADDLDELESALQRASDVDDRPSLLILRSHIATPSPDHTDDHEAHGYALLGDDITATKHAMGVPDEPFWVPREVLDWYRGLGRRHESTRLEWESRLSGLGAERVAYDACMAGSGLTGWETKLPTWEAGESIATRKASATCLDAMLDVVPGLIGGGADLTGNTGTTLSGRGVFGRTDRSGRQVYFGVREHAMGAALVGAALHGGVLPVGGTFLVFSDYMRPAVRLAALSGAKAVFVWSHDSVGVGEDGPTHQPVEQIMSLRTIPGLTVLRPADANETAQAWQLVLDVDGPVAMILTRQGTPVLDGTAQARGVERGAYVLHDGGSDLTLVGTGSEVAVCLDAAVGLAELGVGARVVSMPSWEFFEAQDDSYRNEVFDGRPVVSLEAGTTLGWDRYADVAVGIDRFGASAPGGRVLAELGIVADNVVATALAHLETTRKDEQT